MPVSDSSPNRYSYSYHGEAGNSDDTASEAKQAADLKYINDTILLLTGGCEICQHSVGPFCQKHKHRIQIGDPRCADFERRLPEDPRQKSRAQVRQYVSERLGVTDGKSVSRLTGVS